MAKCSTSLILWKSVLSLSYKVQNERAKSTVTKSNRVFLTNSFQAYFTHTLSFFSPPNIQNYAHSYARTFVRTDMSVLRSNTQTAKHLPRLTGSSIRHPENVRLHLSPSSKPQLSWFLVYLRTDKPDRQTGVRAHRYTCLLVWLAC